MSTQARKPKGTPVGGQFASQHRAESNIKLQGDLGAAIDPSQQLYGWLDDVRCRIGAGERPTQIKGPFGIHDIAYGDEDGDEYAIIGFALPDHVFAEIDGNTYGQMQGFRIFIESSQDDVAEESARDVDLPNPSSFDNDPRIGLPDEVVQSTLWFTGQAVRDHFDEDVDDLSDSALDEIGRKARYSVAIQVGYEDAMQEALDEWRTTHCACETPLADNGGKNGLCGTCADRKY